MNIYVILLILTNIFWALIAYLQWERIIDVKFQLRAWEATHARLIDYVNERYMGARNEQARAAQATHGATPEQAEPAGDQHNGSRYPGVQSGT